MRIMALLAIAAIVLSGCASEDEPTQQSFDCPDEYGEGFEAQYEEIRKDYQNRTGEELADADRDCAPDVLEDEIGTDPQNATDYPSIEELQEYAGTSAQPEFDVQTVDGSVTAGVGAPDGLVSYRVGSDDGLVSIKEETTLIFAEMRWDGVMDLDLAMQTPSSAGSTTWEHQTNGGMVGSPDSPQSLTISNPAKGDWGVTAFPNGPVANQPYTIKVTTFFGASEVPEGYTAFA